MSRRARGQPSCDACAPPVSWPACMERVEQRPPAEHYISNCHRKKDELHFFFFHLVSQHPTVSNLIASSALCGGAQRVRVTLNGFFMSNPRLRSEHFSQFGRSRGSQRTVSFADNSGCFWRKSGQQWAGISHVGGRVIYSWENSFVVGGRTCRPHLKKTVCIAHVQTLISSRCKLLQFWLKNESLTSLFFVSGINSSIIWSKKRFHLSVFSFILGSIRFQLNQCK